MADSSREFAGDPAILTLTEQADRAHVEEILTAARQLDGVDPLSEQSVLGVGTLPEVVLADDDTVLGYANIAAGRDGEPAMVEAVVHPHARRHGIGKRLLATALATAGDGARVWAHGDLPAARALASSLGLTPRRILLQLRRSLGESNPLPQMVIPSGITIRTYQPGDDDAIVAVNNRAFEWHPEQGGWDERQVRERVESDWFDPQGLFLAVDDATERLLGFHWTKVVDGIGEVYIVGVDPQAQGRGVGKTLTLAGLHYLSERGLPTVLLYVEGDNDAALATYRNLGFSEFTKDVAYGA